MRTAATFTLLALGLSACATVLGLSDYTESSTTVDAGGGGVGGEGTGAADGGGGMTGGAGGTGPVLTLDWSATLSGPDTDWIGGLDIDASHLTSVCGTFRGTLSDGDTLSVTDPGGGNIFAARVDALGDVTHLVGFGDDAPQTCRAATIDGNNRTYIVGDIEGTTTINSMTVGPIVPARAYVARFSPQFVDNQFVVTGGDGPQRAHAVATDSSSGLFIGGGFNNDMDSAGDPVMNSAVEAARL